MRKLLFVVAILVILPAVVSRAEPQADGAGYRLDVGDELRIKVFEWRSSVGDVHEWTALNGDYTVAADGAVAMPLLGALKAAGQSTDQLAETISTQLQSRFGLSIRPQTSIEIVEYRPFYILGDVNKPSAYPYQPGLTVLQAISIAGGRYRVNDPALLLTTAGDLRVYHLQYTQLLARRARLQAERDNATAITFPQELLSQQNDPKVAQVVQREQSMFAAQRDALTSEVNALNQLKSLISGEVSSLQDKMKNIDQELTLMKGELSNTTNLVQQGLAIAPREYSLRETELETEGRRLDLDTASLRAKEDISKADQALVELRNKTRDQIQTELSDTEQKLSETAARIATGVTIVGSERGRAQASSTAAEDMPAICIILRTKDGKPTQVEGDETTKVAPGDTIKVTPAGVGKSALDLEGETVADPPLGSTEQAPSTVTPHHEGNLVPGGRSDIK